MSLKKYLLICYGLFLVGWTANTLIWKGTDPNLPLLSMLIFGVFGCAIGTFVWIWPGAQKVPVEERTSFWAYRSSNRILGWFGALLTLVALIAIVTFLQRP